MKISSLGFTFFSINQKNQFESGAIPTPTFPPSSVKSSYPSITIKPPILPTLTDDKKIPFSFLLHERSEKIKDLLWSTRKTKSRSTTKQSQKNVTLRKQILNCPQDQIFDLLKSQGLLSDDEFIPSSLSLKERK